jgi:hypothetical protein
METTMIPTYKIPYRKGELRIGWASWDDGSLTARSIKYAYPDGSGKISRGSPELPFDILVDMCLLATEQEELEALWKAGRNPTPPPLTSATADELHEEKKRLTVVLMRLQQLVADVPWADWARVYDPIGSRLEAVKVEIARQKAAA